MIIMLTGAGGAGKTTILNGLRQVLPELKSVQKWTTRARRDGEGEREFRFVSATQFQAARAADALADWSTFGGHSYGIPRTELDKLRAQRQSAAVIVDADGARNLKRLCGDQAIWIFLQVPEADLRRRMEARGETTERIGERLRLAPKREYPEPGEADLVIDNADGKQNQTIGAIVKAVQNRVA